MSGKKILNETNNHIKRTKLLESERQNTDNNEETELTLRKGGGESRPGIAQETITINW